LDLAGERLKGDGTWSQTVVFVTDRIQSFLDRLSTYPAWQVLVELVVIWIVVYVIFRFVQGTRAAGALKGLLVLLIVVTVLSRVFGGTGSFQRLGLLYDRFLALVAISLVVIFQPELRRALVRLGETPFFRTTPKDLKFIADEIATAAAYLSKAKFGAIIVVERNVGLAGLVEGGTVLGAELSSRLLQTIFFPGSALHDLAVIIKGRTIHAAGVQLPLAEAAEMPDPSLGSRHRAAVGLSRECDAIVVVVSEETGACRIAERGRLSDRMTPAVLRQELEARMARVPLRIEPTAEAREEQLHHERVVAGASEVDLGAASAPGGEVAPGSDAGDRQGRA
jgi:diadenylate cyclase